MRIFVTGAGGFIGSCIMEYLQSSGHDVTGHVHSRDGDLEPEAIPRETEVIVNSAGRLGSQGAMMEELRLSNVLLPRMLGKYCTGEGVHMVHLSTPGVTGLIQDATEDLDPDPRGDYEITKTEAELILQEICPMDSGLLTILRPDFVYGPGDLHKLPLFRQSARGWMPLIGWSGAHIRPTYCMDLCRAVEASLPGGNLNTGLFNIAGPEIVSMRELAGLLGAAMGRRVYCIPVPMFVFSMALLLGPFTPSSLSSSRLRLFGRDHYVSTRKAETAGFSASYDLREGLGRTVDWYRGRGLLG